MTKRVLRTLIAPFLTVMGYAGEAYAAGSNMPWESMFSDIVRSVQGPTLAALATLAIIGAGYKLSTGDNTSGVRSGLWTVVGISVAVSAANFILPWLGFAGGALVK